MAKKRTLNELRQTKEYYVAKQKVLSDGGFDTNEEMKQIAECVKEIEEIDPVQQVLAQQIDEDLEEGIKEMVNERPKEFSEIYQEIANKVIDDIEDQLFELINEYSDDYDELYWNRYLTDDAPVELLDAAFENYHEHYDNIFKIIMKHFITN